MKVKNDHRSKLENLLRWSFFTFNFINTWGTNDLTFDYYWKQLQQPVWRYVCVMDVFIRVAFTWLYNALYLQHFMSFHIHRIEIPHRAFPERVGPRILLLESVDYFRASDYFSDRNKRTILMSKTSRFTGKLGSRIGDRGSVKKKLEIK